MNNNLRSSQPERTFLVPRISFPAQDDVSLIKASQQGDQEAFSLLVRKHQRPLFTLAWHLLQNDEQARIITQDTFLAAWKMLSALPRDVTLSLWLSHLLYQRCMQQLKQCIPGQGRDTAHQRESHPQQEAMDAGADLSSLPTISRAVVVLRYVQGLSYEEIALVLTLPIRMVKAHLFGARTWLKEQLRAHYLSDSLSQEEKQRM